MWNKNNDETRQTLLQIRLWAKTDACNLKFDHMKIGHLGNRVAVFVVQGKQSTVLYDKTHGFPSAKLLASLVLLGSP